MSAATRFLVSGRVQGVGFRAFVRRQALRLGLRGSAANLADGRVEVIVLGTDDAIDRLEQALRAGPPLSRVTGVERDEISAEINETISFVIK